MLKTEPVDLSNLSVQTVIVQNPIRSSAGSKMAEVLHDIVKLVPDDELVSLLSVTLTWMKDNGYNLQDTPENLIAKLMDNGKENSNGC